MASKRKTSKTKTTKSRVPETMDALLAEYGGKVRALSPHQKVKGKVISKTSKRLILDIDRKSEGLVAEKAFNEAKEFIKALREGDEVTASVIIPETSEGYAVLSLREAQQDAAWNKIEKAKKKGEHLVVFGRGVNPSGVKVEVKGLIGFIPNSQLGKEVTTNSRNLVGKHFKVVVLEADRANNKMILSEKEVSEVEDIKLANKALKKIKEGEIYKGEVITVTDFGCFVRIQVALGKKSRKAGSRPAGEKVPVEGLVHISELSWGKVENIRDAFSVGDKVKVKVIGVNKGRLALSIKQAQKDPWTAVEKKYQPDSKVKGKIVRVSDFGVFVVLEPGVEGLIHMTKIPPGTKLSQGQNVDVYVEKIDTKVKKLSLGLVLTKKPVGYK